MYPLLGFFVADAVSLDFGTVEKDVLKLLYEYRRDSRCTFVCALACRVRSADRKGDFGLFSWLLVVSCWLLV